MTNDDLFLQAAKQVSAELEAEGAASKSAPIEEPQDENQQDKPHTQLFGLADGIEAVAGETVAAPFRVAKEFTDSIGAGVGEAIFETKDFLVGEPEDDDKSSFRKGVEQERDRLDATSPVNAFTSGVSQFVTGMLGAGKLTAPLKLTQKSKKVQAAAEIAKGAGVGAVVIDPHEQRLSNLIQQFPELDNPVTEYLAAKPDDSDAEGRFKNALEGIGIDLALVGTFMLATKGLRSLRQAQNPNASADDQAKAFADYEVSQAGLETPKAKPILVEAPSVTKQVEQTASPLPEGRKPQVTVEVSEVEAIVKGSREDIIAINQYGTREAAIAAGYKFNAQVKLPWQKLRDSDGVNDLVANTAQQLKVDLDKIKGGDVLSDASVRQMVGQRASLFNEDPDLLLGKVIKSGENAKSAVADMEAAYLVSSKMFQDTYDTAMKIRNGLLDEWGGDAAKATNELRARMQASAEIYGSARSITAASGRALRRMRGQAKIKPEDIENIASLDGEKLAELLYSTKGDPKKMAQAMSPSFLKRAMNEATFSLTNSLLWLYPTHVVNMTSNLYMLGARPAEKILGSLIQEGINKASGGSLFKGVNASPIRKQAMMEYKYTVTALSDGWDNAVQAFKKGDSIINPHSSKFFEDAGSINQKPLQWRKLESIEDLAVNAYASANYRNIVGLPTRSLGAMDELVKTSRYRAVVQARAAVDGEVLGHEGQALRDYVSNRMVDAFDEAGEGIDPAAIKEAQATTFTQELLPDTLGAGIRNLRAGFPALTFVLPFVKTPINVLRYATKMTPVLNLAQKEYREMISGKLGAEAQAQAIGQMSMGAMFMGLAATLAVNGKLTGAGPSDLHLKKELLNTGWKPYSFVQENADGSRTYIPIGRFDPVGMPFGMMADLVEMKVLHPNTKEAKNGMGALLIALAQNFSEKTFLLNLNQMLRAMTDPSSSGEKFAGNIIGSSIPLSSLIKAGNPDPYLRDARTVVDNAMKNMPAYSETLDPQRDVFGEPMWKRMGLTSNQDTDIVQAEHNRIIQETGEGIGKVSPNRNGTDLRDIKLDDGRSAYNKLQEFIIMPSKNSRSLKQALEKLIRSPQYARLVDGDGGTKGTRLNAFSTVLARYRQAAYKRLLREYPEVRQAVSSRKIDIRSALIAKKSQGGNPSAELFEALGIEAN